jgi:hypothetical protein
MLLAAIGMAALLFLANLIFGAGWTTRLSEIPQSESRIDSQVGNEIAGVNTDPGSGR